MLTKSGTFSFQKVLLHLCLRRAKTEGETLKKMSVDDDVRTVKRILDTAAAAGKPGETAKAAVANAR